MRITISGTPGSGKSTVAKWLARHLGYAYVNAGQIFRDAAAKRDMTLAEFAAHVRRHPSIDRALDAALLRNVRAHDDVIAEGRLAGWMTKRARIPALRVWITARESTRVRRLMERDGGTRTEVRRALRERTTGDRERYLRTYRVDLRDMRPYTVIIATDTLTVQQTASRILAELRATEHTRTNAPRRRRVHHRAHL